MRFYDNGSCYTVSVSAREVDAFKATWPGSGLPSTPVAFEFEKASGDLVDMRELSTQTRVGGPALLALSQDAQAYGLRRINRKGKDNEPV